MVKVDYWHKHHYMPDEAKEELKKIVCGDFVAILTPNNHESVSLLKVSSETFANAFTYNRNYLYRGDYTAPPAENSYGDDGCYLTEDGLAGFSITEKNWLVSLYSNQPWKGFLGMVVPYLKRATKLVCIVNSDNENLVEAYKNVLGFRIIARTTDDMKIMTEYYGDEFIDNFVHYYGHPHHVFMYRPLNYDEEREIKVFENYFEAEEYVDEEIK